jgi:hypothetical protein
MQTALVQGQAFKASPAGYRMRKRSAFTPRAVAAPEAPAKLQRPDKSGRFGKFGGKYVPETLIPALEELEVAYKNAQADPSFQVGTSSLTHKKQASNGMHCHHFWIPGKSYTCSMLRQHNESRVRNPSC